MKNKNIFAVSAMLLMGVAALTSCSDDETYDVHGYDYNRAYFNKAGSTTDGNVMRTPVGIITSFSDIITGNSTAAVQSTTTLSVTVDNSLVDSYNSANGTHYKQLPDGVVTMDKTTLTIPAGAMTSSDTLHLSIDDTAADALNDTTGYIMPIVISSVSGDTRPSSDAAVRYVHIGYLETSSLINDYATEIAGTKADLSTMTCIAATNLNPDEFSGLFAGGWRARWTFTGDDPNASFVLDLGSTHNLAGFHVQSEVLKNAKVSISTDNQTWTEIGETAGHTALRIYDQSTWSYNREFVLYAPLQARYFKAELELDNSSWYWSWYKYINSISLYYQD